MNLLGVERELLQRAQQQPHDLQRWRQLGDTRFALGHYAGALECYERVLAAEDDIDCLIGFARCLSRRPLLARRVRTPGLIERCLTDERVDPDLVGPAALVLVRDSGDWSHPLLQPVLRNTFVTDPVIERELVRVRRELTEPTPLAEALAVQGRLNEYVWPVSDEEQARWADAPQWVRAMYGPVEAPDSSASVRELYEANPYPSWRRISRGTPQTLPDRPRPEVLVAGCGTGRELLTAAYNWQPSAVTAFDLSRTSLDVAQARAEQLGIEVEFHTADLLDVGDWDRRFDVIVCTGVLHHLPEPVRGWRELVRLLEPGGLMLVGLYSATARQGISVAQEQVRGMGIRQARAHILELGDDDPARDVMLLQDFYYTSGCRDLLFHVQERHFTIAEIAAALADLGLQFVDFDVPGEVRQRYRTLFGAASTPAHWEAFEQLYPHTFLGMYQFWCKRPESI